MSASPAKRRAIWVIVAIVVGLPACYLVWTVADQAQTGADWNRTREHLKQIGLALHHYHETYDTFPPAYTLGPDGKPWHSWRVLILPQLGEQKLYEQYHFDEPWNGPNNTRLLSLRPDVYSSPLQTSRTKGVTSFLGIVSRRTMWPGHVAVQIQDVVDGTSNTIQLIWDQQSDVSWSEPREMRERDAIEQLESATATRTVARFPLILVLMADGRAMSLSQKLDRTRFVALMTPQFASNVYDGDWPYGEDDRRGPPGAVDISSLAGVSVLTIPEVEIQPGKTSLYCATNQLAWDLLRPSRDQPVQFEGMSRVASELNRHPFPASSLAPETYFAGASGLDTKSTTGLFEQLRGKFPESRIEILDSPADLRGVRLLAYLQKSMPFVEVLERIAEPLRFNDAVNVNSFGSPESKADSETPVLQKTVQIADFVSPNEFVVILHSDSRQRDEIILARVSPEETLQSTWEATLRRLQSPRATIVVRSLREKDRLQIPILSFGVSAPLNDLIGLQIPTPSYPERFIADARQVIRFRLDEYGAELIADTQMILGEFDGPEQIDPHAPRRMVFDKPFLIAIREKDAEAPFLLAWIGNADLMEEQSAVSAK